MDHHTICQLLWDLLGGNIGDNGLVGPTLGACPSLIIWGPETFGAHLRH
jgi:hypothetical protein